MNPLDPHAFTLENAVDPKAISDTVPPEAHAKPVLSEGVHALARELRRGLAEPTIRPCQCATCLATTKGDAYRGAPPLEIAGRCPAVDRTPVHRTRWQRLRCWLGLHRSLAMGKVNERNESSWAWEHCACGATRLVILKHRPGASVQRHPWNFPAKTL